MSNINEVITVDMIKDLCNRLVVTDGDKSKSVVYYTKGGKIVDVENIKGNLNLPFRLGDKFKDLESHITEKGYQTDSYPRRRKIRESEEEKPEPQKDSSIFGICYTVLSGKYDDELIEELLYEHRKHYDDKLKDIITNGRGGGLVYAFDDTSDFADYFFDNEEESYSIYEAIVDPDYSFYEDSVDSDIREGYAWSNLETKLLLPLIKKIESIGFKIADIDESKFLSQTWSYDENIIYRVGDFFRDNFPSIHEKIEYNYYHASITSYAEGFNEAVKKAHKQWIDSGFDEIGLIEVDIFESYEVDIASLFKFLIRPSSGKSNLKAVIEKSPQLRNTIGESGFLTGWGDARYENQKDEPFLKLKEKQSTIINEWIESIDDEYGDIIRELNNDAHILKKYDLNPYIIKKNTESGGYGWFGENLLDTIMKTFDVPKNHIILSPDKKKYIIYLGYSLIDEGHKIVIIDSEYDNYGWGSKYHKDIKNTQVVSVETLIKLMTQYELDLNEILDLNIKTPLVEQDSDIMSVYYAMMSKLIEYYGENNVDLRGNPAKIYIYKTNIVTWNGDDLFLTKEGKTERIKVTEMSSNSYGNQVTYPSIKYITNRIPKVGSKKVQNTPQKSQTKPSVDDVKKSTQKTYNTKEFKDGTTLRVSQYFWDNIKLDEGRPGTNGEPVLKAYKLGDGRVTIGWGHTGALTGPTPKPFSTITKSEALKYLQNDATEAANCVRRILGEWKTKGLSSYMVTQGMFDSMVSIVFNAGCDGLRTSNFIKYVKNKQYQKAAKILPTDTTMINGNFTKGLTARRVKEAKRFLS